MFTPEGCGCDRMGEECPIPDGCRDLLGDIGACGS
jgi:hypothetical protein